MVAAILTFGAILIICVSNPRIRILIGISMFVIKRMQDGNKSLGMLKNFTLSPVACITVDFKKLVSDPFHTGST